MELTRPLAALIPQVFLSPFRCKDTLFGIGEADIIPLHEALLYGNQDAIPSADIRFGSTLLEILGDDAEGEYVAAVDAVYESTEHFN